MEYTNWPISEHQRLCAVFFHSLKVELINDEYFDAGNYEIGSF